VWWTVECGRARLSGEGGNEEDLKRASERDLAAAMEFGGPARFLLAQASSER
jgi:hypothetical protein